MTGVADHAPIITAHPRTYNPPQPAEIYATCICGEWEYAAQEDAGGYDPCWWDDYDKHIEEQEDQE